jgi:hypothetical protein
VRDCRNWRFSRPCRNTDDDGAGASSEFSRVGVGLNLELLQGLDRRLHELHVLAAKRVRVGDVVHAVEQEHVVERAVAVDVEDALEVDAREPRRAGKDSRREERELVVVAAVERQIDDFLLIDHRAARRRLRVEQGRAGGDLDDLRELAWLQRQVDARHLRHLERDAGAEDPREPAGLDGHRVLTRSKAGDGIRAFVAGFRADCDVGPDVGDRDDGPGDQRAGRVPHLAGDRRGFLLRERVHRRDEQERREQPEVKPPGWHGCTLQEEPMKVPRSVSGAGIQAPPCGDKVTGDCRIELRSNGCEVPA